MAIIHDLNTQTPNQATVYITEASFIIYKLENKRFYEFYHTGKGSAIGFGSIDSQFVNGVRYNPTKKHFKEGYLHKVNLRLTNTQNVFVFQNMDGSIIDTTSFNTINPNARINKLEINNNYLFVETSAPGTIKVSLSINPTDPHFHLFQGSLLAYKIHPKLINETFCVHYYIDDTLIKSKIVKPNKIGKLSAIQPPYLERLDDGGIFISWESTTQYTWYTVIRRNKKLKSPWNVVGVYSTAPPLIDRGIDTLPSGDFYYKIIGHKGDDFVMGYESFIHLPNTGLMSDKPHVRVTTNYQLTRLWANPVIINC